MYYYPCTTNKGKTYCVIGPKSEISALVSMIKQDVNDYLSSTLCECYMKHDCFTVDPITPPSMSPTNNRTSVTTTTIMTAATPEHQFYPINWRQPISCLRIYGHGLWLITGVKQVLQLQQALWPLQHSHMWLLYCKSDIQGSDCNHLLLSTDTILFTMGT